MLGGSQVETPLVSIETCSNAFAADRNILPYAGNTLRLDTVDYVIGDD